MLTARVNPQSRKLIISYPSFAKVKEEKIIVRSYDQASDILRAKLMKFIVREIRSFINMRRYIYRKNGTMYAEREKALAHLQMIIDCYGTGSIYRLSKHVANARVSFSTLMPLKESPSLTYFNNHIIPIIQYCTEYYKAKA